MANADIYVFSTSEVFVFGCKAGTEYPFYYSGSTSAR
jgi:hypothetical protein